MIIPQGLWPSFTSSLLFKGCGHPSRNHHCSRAATVPTSDNHRPRAMAVPPCHGYPAMSVAVLPHHQQTYPAAAPGA